MRHSRAFFMFACLLALSTLTLGSCAEGASHSTQLPRFDTGSCPFIPGANVVADKNLTCGTLTVYEDRQHPSSAHLVRLPVAIFTAPGPAATASDPIVYLTGGPGAGIVQSLGRSVTPDWIKQIFGNRELILFDQRGTGLSTPSLACPEYQQALYTMLAKNASGQQATDMEHQALTACENRVRRAGVDPALYTTKTNAADVHDLLLALHLPHVSLFGGSYGTRLALEVMRDFPDRLRSVILDSSFPPQDNLYDDHTVYITRAFLHIAAVCTADPSCSRAHPDVQARFFEDIARLGTTAPTFDIASPSTNQVYHVTLSPGVLASEVVGAMYSTQTIAEIPLLLDEISQGDYYTAVRLAAATLSDESIAQGMYDSVECAEDAPYATQQALDAALATLPKQWSDFVGPAAKSQADECSVWTVPAAPPSEKAAITSAIPTLIFEGGFDPVTPREDGALTAKTLSHSYEAFFPYETHGVLFPNGCAQQIAQEFLDSPLATPDRSCIAQQPPLTFA